GRADDHRALALDRHRERARAEGRAGVGRRARRRGVSRPRVHDRLPRALIMRRFPLVAFVAAAVLLGVALPSPGAGDEGPPIGVVDLHVDVPWQVHFKHRDAALTEGHASIANLKAGHYVGIVMPIYMPDKAHKDGPHIEDADAIFDSIKRTLEANKLFLPLLSPVAQEGRISTFLGIEGAGAFAADITAIDRFIDRGLRVVSPCHQQTTKLASS